jgi:indolepyruvate ferredoxin oxidoreductase
VSQTLERTIERRAGSSSRRTRRRRTPKRYTDFVAEGARRPSREGGRLDAAHLDGGARYLFKLMAVQGRVRGRASLHWIPIFSSACEAQYEGDYSSTCTSRRRSGPKNDPATGEPRKRFYGPWMLKAMSPAREDEGPARTALDVFGYSAERRGERALIDEYRKTVEGLLDGLTPQRVALAAEIASIPEFIRGYGPVKERHLKDAKARESDLLAQWKDPTAAAKPRIPIKAAA